jgi:hypothetical protein
MRLKVVPVLFVWLVCLGGMITQARAERVQKGNLIASLDGGIAPLALPRGRDAPVSIHLAGGVSTSDGSPVPRISGIDLVLAGHGKLDTRGLPVCPRARLRTADPRQALRRCGPALVGRGRLGIEVAVPHQAPFPATAKLLAFNGRSASGGPAVWVHAFAANPPVSLVLPLSIERRRRGLGTRLTLAVPHSVGPVPRLTRFQLTLFRRFLRGGSRQSYLSASCPIPENLTAGFISFVRATYRFDDGRRLRLEKVRSCRAR